MKSRFSSQYEQSRVVPPERLSGSRNKEVRYRFTGLRFERREHRGECTEEDVYTCQTASHAESAQPSNFFYGPIAEYGFSINIGRIHRTEVAAVIR